jgi:hypothetical protein
VSGGFFNTASGGESSISGGQNNTASGFNAAISGGAANTASGNAATVSGGFNRIAEGTFDWVAGSLVEDEQAPGRRGGPARRWGGWVSRRHSAVMSNMCWQGLYRLNKTEARRGKIGRGGDEMA